MRSRPTARVVQHRLEAVRAILEDRPVSHKVCQPAERQAIAMGIRRGDGDQMLGVSQVAWLCGVGQKRMRTFVNEGRLGTIVSPRVAIIPIRDAIRFAESPRKEGRPKKVRENELSNKEHEE